MNEKLIKKITADNNIMNVIRLAMFYVAKKVLRDDTQKDAARLVASRILSGNSEPLVRSSINAIAFNEDFQAKYELNEVTLESMVNALHKDFDLLVGFVRD